MGDKFHSTFNRTIIELKLFFVDKFFKERCTFNRTIIELKHNESVRG